jgi:hypothetical protein
MAITFLILVLAVVFGRKWWDAEAAEFSANIYKPLEMHAALETRNVLDLKITDPGWLSARKLNDFVPDHNHLMHLYAIRWPAMDVVFHLHPELVRRGEFQLALPSMPAGGYRLYADVVHANGFPETLVTSLALPEIHGRRLPAMTPRAHRAQVHEMPAIGCPMATACNGRDPRRWPPKRRGNLRFNSSMRRDSRPRTWLSTWEWPDTRPS